MGGRVHIFVPADYPAYVRDLFSNQHFIDNIRAYNQMFAMTSLGATIDESVNVGRGPYVFKVSGNIYHRIGKLCPESGETPRFLQLYIYDTGNEVENRLTHFGENARATLRPEIVEGLIEFLDHNNALVQLFRTVRDKLKDSDVPEFKVRLFSVIGSPRHELPTADSIGAIVYESGPQSATDFDVVIQLHSGEPQRINKLHPCYMSLQFPLLFVYGQQGYDKDQKLIRCSGDDADNDKRVTMNAYYAYMLHDRVGKYNLPMRGGRLFQQYVVTAYCAIEQSRMDFIRKKQSDIRGDFLRGVYDAMSRGDNDGSDVGSRIILPASFTGGPRYMYSHYLDALAICRIHGNPTFFVTFTCNVHWPEIQQYMEAFPNLTTADRPDVVDRVFERKIHLLVKYVRDHRPFGNICAVLYTVEFQKRGLPHCHMLFWNDAASKIRSPEDVDKYVSAELPPEDTDPEGFRVISEFMIHGPCGAAAPNAPCMRDRLTCKKSFPKSYCNNTYIDKSGYVHYRRRDTFFRSMRNNMRMDNGYVVPYNRSLSMKFYAHINVECCGWTMVIKYLFKYISKGTDKIVARITRASGPFNAGTSQPSTSTVGNSGNVTVIDEIKNFVDARYIGPHEACWRILNFDIHSREPAVQILSVHLENMQRVVFRGTQSLQSVIDNPGTHKTTLTQWLAFNRGSTIGRHLTYVNFPSEFVWSLRDKEWYPRQNTNKPSIGRLTYIHPAAGDLFFQRLLLCHQKGCTSFGAIRTVDNHTYRTNRAAAEAMGLLENDGEWSIALEEAAATATASELRALFVQILVFCDVSDPVMLFNAFWEHMSHDVPRTLGQLFGTRVTHINEPELKGGVLYELESALNFYGKTLEDFGIQPPPEGLLNILTNKMIMEEKCYDREELTKERDILVPKLNNEQRQIFEMIMHSINDGIQELLFVYGHGGTGKTFLWKAIITALRSEAKIVLAVASSGIASLLLPAGRTAHSRFKLPLNLTDETLCSIKRKTQLADLLHQTDLIIWDEAPMNDRRCFEALDRTLRDICETPEKLFGGKTIMFGGDFRQTMPVKKKATRNEVIASSISESYLWQHLKIVFLQENMRLQRDGMDAIQRADKHAFSEWLLNIGDGKMGIPDEEDPQNASWIHIPDRYCYPPTEEGKWQLIKFIYDDQTLNSPSAQSFQDKTIVCPKNETADMINLDIDFPNF